MSKLNFTFRRQITTLTVYDANDKAVATFDKVDDTAFRAFSKGLSLTVGASLYDLDNGRFITGTLEQLLSGE